MYQKVFRLFLSSALFFGTVLLLAWQLMALGHLVTAISADFARPPVLSLSFALYLLVLSSLEGRRYFFKAAMLKVSILWFGLLLACGLVGFILLAYMGGWDNFGRYLHQLYAVTEGGARLEVVSLWQGSLVTLLAVIFVLKLLAHPRADHCQPFVGEGDLAGQKSKSPQVKRITRLKQAGIGAVFLGAVILVLLYGLLLGLGAHFVGGNPAYNAQFGQETQILLEPVQSFSGKPRLVVMILFALMPIIPIFSIFLASFIIILLLLSSQFLLLQASAIITNDLGDVLGDITFRKARFFWQRRLMAIMLMVSTVIPNLELLVQAPG